MQLTPSEILDEVLVAAGVAGHACRWGNTTDRLDCLEKMRGLARKYEERCRNTGAPRDPVRAGERRSRTKRRPGRGRATRTR